MIVSAGNNNLGFLQHPQELQYYQLKVPATALSELRWSELFIISNLQCLVMMSLMYMRMYTGKSANLEHKVW